MAPPYNPITHAGEAAGRVEARRTGVKLVAAGTATGHLAGSACVPAATPRGAAAEAAGAAARPARPRDGAGAAAKVDHLAGTACCHRAGAAAEPPRAAPARPHVDLRASVDHLAGGACTVRDVRAQVRAGAWRVIRVSAGA
jgi:hypothetical protein